MPERDTAADALAQTVASVYGEPVGIERWREATSPRWLVEGFLARSGVTLLSAKGGAGKSLLTTDLAVRMAAGDDGYWLDSFQIAPGPLRVAIVEAENGASRIRRRVRELVMGDAFPPELADVAADALKLFPAEALQKREEVLAALPALIAHWALDVVIIDPLRSFFPAAVADENDNVSVGRVLDSLVSTAKRSYAAILVVDHDSKAGGAARGASSKQDGAEIVWQLTMPDPSDDDYLELRAHKQRDPGGPTRLAVARIKGERDSDGMRPIRFSLTDTREPNGKPTDYGTLDDRIVRCIETHHKATGSGIALRRVAENLGVSKDKIHRRAKYLSTSGRIYQPEGGSLYPSGSFPGEQV